MQNKIVFQPMGIVATIEDNETILHAAQRVGVHISAYCGSQKVCGKCLVKIVEGISNISPITDAENKLLTNKEIADNYRLACTTRVKAGIVVEIPKASRTSEEVILKKGKEKEIELKPAVKKYYLELEKATLNDNKDDVSRIKEALIIGYEELSEDLEIDIQVLKKLPKILRESNWKITATILHNKKIINVEQGKNNRIYGLAIDVGTTTIAAYLCDLLDGKVKQTTSMMNPQIRFGDDVLTRVSHCVNVENGVEELQKLLIDGLNTLVEQLSEEEKIFPEQIVEVVIVFNTVMQHIALGISPAYIGVSPFVSTIAESIDMTARDFGIKILQSGNVHCLPFEAGFIGSDNVAVLISEEPYLQDKMKLIIDIGTNSEICLGNKNKLYTTSCATGPALEGAQIRCGMRAAKGAIEAVEINPVTLEPRLRVIGEEDKQTPLGICGSGILDVVSQMAITGIIEPDGKFSKKIVSNRIRCGEDGKKEYILYFKDKDVENDIVVTQKDVRAVQLAKAALYAGAKALMKRSGIESLDEIVLAGAFGSYLDKNNALKLGLYPDCHIDSVTVVGNAAGLGARLALVNVDKRKEARDVARDVEYVETAKDLEYQRMFAQAMAIPHEKDSFTRNQSYKWSCSGKDDRAIAQEVLALGMKSFNNADVMEKAILAIREDDKTEHLTFPLMQKIEAVAFGAETKLVGNNYIISDYMYQSLEQLGKNQSILENIVIKNTIECISRHSNEQIVLEVVGPFSILATLINPSKLYTFRRKNKEMLMDVLDRLVYSLSEYTIEGIKRGVNIISFADPEGVTEIVGEGFYKDLSGAATYAYFKKIEPYLNKALVHICGKTSYSMQKAGFITTKVYRVEQGKEYMELLLEYAGNKNFQFVGHSCIHTRQLSVPIINKIELVNDYDNR